MPGKRYERVVLYVNVFIECQRCITASRPVACLYTSGHIYYFQYSGFSHAVTWMLMTYTIYC